MGTPSPRRGHAISYQSSSRGDPVFRKRVHEIKPEYVLDARLQIAWMLGETKKKQTPLIERILFLHIEREMLRSIWVMAVWYRLILFDGREYCGWCSVEEAEAIQKRRPQETKFLSRLRKVQPRENERAARPNQAHLQNLKQFRANPEQGPGRLHGPLNRRPKVLH